MPKPLLALPLEDQLAAAPELMRAYKLLYKGACPFFGKLVPGTFSAGISTDLNHH
jgi:hypothetical protein